MKKLLVMGTIAVLVAVIGLAAVGATSAFAQGPTGTTPPMFGRGLGLAGLGRNWGGPQNSLVAVAAKLFGMDQTALITELNTGKTLADIAKAKNVATDKIIDAFLAPRAEALKNAVTAKQITQAQADSTLASMKADAQKELTSKYTPHAYGAGRGQGMGQGFVDANKDGICDNCGTNQPAGTTFGPRGRWNTK
jgi:hypothetical protein